MNDPEELLNMDYYIKHIIATCLNYYCKILHVIKLRIHGIPISVMFHIPELPEMSIPTILFKL